LEKMLVHQMAVLHYGMMRATAQMNWELDAADREAATNDPYSREPNVRREAANVRACRLAGAASRMSSHLSASPAHATAQANRREPGGHGEAHSSTGERDARRARGGRRRQGNEQDQGTAGERRTGATAGDGQK